jgi:hypothetical protein
LLSGIEGKLDDLSKKVAGKWFMPLVLVVITALMGIANFLVTRYYANTDLYGNKLKEKIAELQGEQILIDYTEITYCEYHWFPDPPQPTDSIPGGSDSGYDMTNEFNNYPCAQALVARMNTMQSSR